MTAPVLASGGLQVTVGPRPRILTEYAPVTVINLSTTSRVYLASDSNVSNGTGVPLDPSTSYDWQTPGPLYAVLDTGAPDTSVTMVLTGAGGDWSPSPVAIGAAVASQLLQSGVPITYTETLIANGVLITAGAAPKTFDVSKYSELLIYAFATVPGAANRPLQYSFNNGASYSNLYDGNGVSGPGRMYYRIKVTDTQLTINTPSPSTFSAWTLFLYGTNRNSMMESVRNDETRKSTGIACWDVTLSAGAAAGNYALPLYGLVDNEIFAGPATCYLLWNTSDFTKPFTLNCQVNSLVGGGAFSAPIADSGMTAAIPNKAGFQRWQGQLAFPIAPYSLQLNLPTALASAARYTLYAIPAF